MQARFWTAEDAAPWDAFCAQSTSATFLHSRRFLSYHGDRFVDRSVIVEDAGRWLGVMPAALATDDETRVVSHPGITYGGLVHRGALRGSLMLDALDAVRGLLAGSGARRLVYKAVPTIYHRSPAQDDLYALFRAGARRIRCDLSTCIDLRARLEPSERRRRAARKAARAGLAIVSGRDVATDLWTVLDDNLRRRHGVRPVHTLAEIELLAGRFPDEIAFVAARLGEETVAGVVLFRDRSTVHAQYIAASERGHALNALDLVFEHCIADAAAAGARHFDFGISTESQGTVLNDGLYRFKSEFGGAGIVYEFYELDL
jgi:hypothetical protein